MQWAFSGLHGKPCVIWPPISPTPFAPTILSVARWTPATLTWLLFLKQTNVFPLQKLRACFSLCLDSYSRIHMAQCCSNIISSENLSLPAPSKIMDPFTPSLLFVFVFVFYSVLTTWNGKKHYWLVFCFYFLFLAPKCKLHILSC